MLARRIHEPQVSRKHFRSALQGRNRLDGVERALLHAHEPLVMRSPADVPEALKRLEAALVRFPDEPPLAISHALIMAHEDTNRAITLLERALKISPQRQAIRVFLSEFQAYAGNFEEALRTAAKCVEQSPSAITCSILTAIIYSHQGRCAEAAHAARQVKVRDPDTQFGHMLLASALAAQGKAEGAVMVVAKQRWPRLPEHYRELGQSSDEASIATFFGDFPRAESLNKRFKQLIATDNRRRLHALHARRVVKALLEQGRGKKALAVVKHFIDSREGWEADPRSEDFAIAADGVPTMWRAMRELGKLSSDELDARRKAWLAEWAKRNVSPANRGFLWLRGFAAAVHDAEDAKRALAALPSYGPIRQFAPRTAAQAHVGRTYLLAGQLDQAMTWLRKATADCSVTTFPIVLTQAHDWLGRALEKKGDTAGACQAYATVLKRWGKAKRSLTADHARKRRAKLACEK